ncbi:DinB family protein [Chitinophaga ginsengisoli]|uniref:DinB family protein n=1 Tax=Chitinophaga ginsengisoli TaxID=363837 RepID=A0A2P8FMW5_9BACT|nr:DinB family protein [Chitinophaga ginsengisoli]PSL23052.1 DinB family protein [Chitinophaga ginsengisoli]
MENSTVKALLKQFNDTIQQWIDQLSNYSIEMLRQRPQTDAWSLGQVYVHIIEDTTFYLEQMQAALASKNCNAERSMRSRARTMFDNNEFPDMVLENPFNDINLEQPQSKDELSRGLISIKDEVNRLFHDIDLSTAKGKTEHPGFAFFDAFEWLHFAEMHMRHHLRQKRRIDEKLFPQVSSLGTHRPT